MAEVNRIEKRFDPTGYSYKCADGTVRQITDLSRDDLLQIVCSSMDLIEFISCQMSAGEAMIHRWERNEFSGLDDDGNVRS